MDRGVDRTQWRTRVLQAAPAVLVALPFLALAVQLLVLRPEVLLFGDDALIDLAVLDALEGARSAGVYSRLGFSHPGPAFFYLAAPVAALTGRASWALYLAVQLLQLCAAVALVEAVRRRFGVGVAAASAAVVLVQVIALGPGVVRSPWNPLVVLLPLALYLVLIGTATGFGPRWCAALFVGTVVVQTNVGTAPIVGVTGAVALVIMLVRRRSARRVTAPGPGAEATGWRSPERRVGLVVSVVFLAATALAWLQPVVDLVANGGDSNIVAIVESLQRESPQFVAGPSVGDAAQVVGREFATIGLGVAYGTDVTRIIDPAAFGLVGPWLLTFGVAVAAAIVVAVGRRRRSAALAQLGAVCLVAVPASVVAVSRIIGGLHWYVVIWAAAVMVPLLIGVLAAAWSTWSLERSRVALGIALAAAVLATGTATVMLVSAPSWSNMPGPGPKSDDIGPDWGRSAVEQTWEVVRPGLDGVESVHISGGDGIWWGLAAGLAVAMEQEGIEVSVDDEFLDKFGPRHESDGREDVHLLIATEGTTAAPAGAELLTTISGVPIYRVPLEPA